VTDATFGTSCGRVTPQSHRWCGSLRRWTTIRCPFPPDPTEHCAQAPQGL